MNLNLIQPLPQLKPYIGKMWVFENSGRLPVEEMKLIVPNGMVKLVIPVNNGLVGKYDNWIHHSKEGSITLIGISDKPAIVDVELDGPHINIGVEFTPVGAYRMFNLRQSEIRNKIFALEDVLGKSAKRINELTGNADSITQKVKLIQSYLASLLLHAKEDLILDYCLQQIETSRGLVTVKELEKRTGFSSRWLYEKFMEKVGLSPKNLSSVTRFMQFYEASANNPRPDFFKDDIYNYFYDQAHFTKEFKRFTGMPPAKFMNTDNGFGHIFYKG